MEIIIQDLKRHHLKDTFTVDVEGYWGDADRFHKDTNEFRNTSEGLKMLKAALTMLDKYQNQFDIPGYVNDWKNRTHGPVECYSDIDRTELFTEDEKEAMRNMIPRDEGNMLLSTIQKVKLRYFDADGMEREVTLKK